MPRLRYGRPTRCADQSRVIASLPAERGEEGGERLHLGVAQLKLGHVGRGLLRRRLPVVTNGRLVGIVSRGDLIKALANGAAPDTTVAPSDAELVREMKERIAREPWVSSRGIVSQSKERILSLWASWRARPRSRRLRPWRGRSKACGESRVIWLSGRTCPISTGREPWARSVGHAVFCACS